jgi:hypothetical protein
MSCSIEAFKTFQKKPPGKAFAKRVISGMIRGQGMFGTSGAASETMDQQL